MHIYFSLSFSGAGIWFSSCFAVECVAKRQIEKICLKEKLYKIQTLRIQLVWFLVLFRLSDIIYLYLNYLNNTSLRNISNLKKYYAMASTTELCVLSLKIQIVKIDGLGWKKKGQNIIPFFIPKHCYTFCFFFFQSQPFQHTKLFFAPYCIFYHFYCSILISKIIFHSLCLRIIYFMDERERVMVLRLMYWFGGKN